MVYVGYMGNTNYVEESPPISFLQEAMDYEEHKKQWIHKVENFQPPKGVHIMQLQMEHGIQKIQEAYEEIQRMEIWSDVEDDYTRDIYYG